MALSPVSLSSLPEAIGLPGSTTVSVSGNASMMALSNAGLAGYFTKISGQFLIVSSGIANEVTLPNTGGAQGTDIGATGTADDTLTLTFELEVPALSDSLSFTFTFLSEEYPEYVGSIYNDFFSVKINGDEVAIDTNSNPISVNNDFFSDTLTPTGTFFDGQTPPLTISAPVEPGEALTLEITISDVGDGIYDSAAFVGDFEFYESQIVYVQFEEGPLDWPASFFSPFSTGGFTMPESGLSAQQRQAVLDDANAIFEDYRIEFVDTAPASGEYSVIHVGGGVSDLPSWMNAPSGLLGRAEKIDYGNKDRSDAAFVLSDEIAAGDTGLISQVLAHEAGHILGLRHISDGSQLMYPFADASRTLIGGPSPLAELNSSFVVTPIGGVQDSHGELARNLGLRDSVELVEEEGFYQAFLKLFTFSLGSTGKVFEARAVLFNDEGEIYQVVDIGDITSTSEASFTAPVFGSDNIVIIGKTTPGGAFDAVLNDGSVNSVDFDSLGESGIMNAVGLDASTLPQADLTFSSIKQNGDLETIAPISTAIIDVSDQLATDGPDIIEGTGAADTLFGLGGNDQIDGKNGNDRLYGNKGNDTLLGSAGNDTLFGWDGNDKVEGGDGADKLSGAAGNDILKAGDGDDRLLGHEGHDRMSGGAGDDHFLGSLGKDTLSGGNGKDTLFGGEGADILKGGKGRDKLSGEDGRDVLKGGQGADNLLAGTGNDTLTGGSGKDRFVFHEGDGKNKIRDFETGTDTLVIGVGASDFSELDISGHDLNPGDGVIDTIVKFADVSIILKGVEVPDLTENDFLI